MLWSISVSIISKLSSALASRLWISFSKTFTYYAGLGTNLWYFEAFWEKGRTYWLRTIILSRVFGTAIEGLILFSGFFSCFCSLSLNCVAEGGLSGYCSLIDGGCISVFLLAAAGPPCASQLPVLLCANICVACLLLAGFRRFTSTSNIFPLLSFSKTFLLPSIPRLEHSPALCELERMLTVPP